MCAWINDPSADISWSRLNEATPSSSTGPSVDVSGNGYFMYIEASSPVVSGSKARLISPHKNSGYNSFFGWFSVK